MYIFKEVKNCILEVINDWLKEVLKDISRKFLVLFR